MMAGVAPEGGLLLVVTRALAVAGLLSASGTAVFRLAVEPAACAGSSPAQAAVIERVLVRLMLVSIGVAMIGLAAWAARVAATLGVRPGGLGDVLTSLQFGHLVLAQAVMLLAAAASAWQPDLARWRIAAGCAGVATLLQAGHGHAYAMAVGGGAAWPVLASATHLAGASCWLGGLLPLLLIAAVASPTAAAQAARRFSPLGHLYVLLVAVSALAQGALLVGGIGALGTTGYGQVVLVKTGLFLVVLGFALLNRYGLGPALRRANPMRARRHWLWSLALQTGSGMVVVLAAGLLSQLPPPMSMP